MHAAARAWSEAAVVQTVRLLLLGGKQKCMLLWQKPVKQVTLNPATRTWPDSGGSVVAL